MSTKSVDKKVEVKATPKTTETKKESNHLATNVDFLNKPEVKAEIARQEKIIGEKLRETITEELTHNYKEKIGAIENKAQEKILAKIKELQEKNAVQLEEEKKFLLEKNAGELINILDNFNIAVEHINKNKDLAGYASGFGMILQMFNKWLIGIGVEQIVINPGDPFNLSQMSVIEKVDSNLPLDCVVSVVRKGYKMYDKVIRFAGVTVSNAKLRETTVATVPAGHATAPTLSVKPLKHPVHPAPTSHPIKKAPIDRK